MSGFYRVSRYLPSERAQNIILILLRVTPDKGGMKHLIFQYLILLRLKKQGVMLQGFLYLLLLQMLYWKVGSRSYCLHEDTNKRYAKSKKRDEGIKNKVGIPIALSINSRSRKIELFPDIFVNQGESELCQDQEHFL